MTFNNLEVLINNENNTLIQDGTNLSIFHDGLNRHVVIKNINTGVTLPEPNTTLGSLAYLIDSDNTNALILNPGTRQLRKLEINGNNFSESIINLNDYNRLKDFNIVGTNITQNVFIPQSGTIQANEIIIGGYLSNVSPGLTIGGLALPVDSICYMYSNNSGLSFTGPWFPFVNDTSQLLAGSVSSVVEYNSSWYFYITASNLANSYGLMIVQTPGVDLNGDWVGIPGSGQHPIGNSTLSTATNLPTVFYLNNIYFVSPDKSEYYTYSIETNQTTTIPLANVNNFTKFQNQLFITTDNDCNVTTITPVFSTGENVLSNFTLGSGVFNLEVIPGKTYVEDTGLDSVVLGAVNTNHFVQPLQIYSV